MMEIKLSKETLDISDSGYPQPIDESLVTQVDPEGLKAEGSEAEGSTTSLGSTTSPELTLEDFMRDLIPILEEDPNFHADSIALPLRQFVVNK